MLNDNTGLKTARYCLRGAAVLHGIASLAMIIDALKILFGGIPGQLVIQITNYCNGACPQCGMRKTSDIARHRLPVEIIKAAVAQCAENGVEAVSFTGGEPFIDIRAIIDLLDYAGRAKTPYLRTGTNGYMLAGVDYERIAEFADRLASTKVRNFWISMDSADAVTHEAMRGLPGVVEGIKRALPVFHARGIYPAVNLGINRNISGEAIDRISGPGDDERFFEAFKADFHAFFTRVIDMGFTTANVCYPMSSGNEALGNPAYGAISGDFAVSFTPEELRLIFRALLEIIPEFRNKIRIFTPLSVLYAMSQGNPALLFPCLGGVRFFYMDSRDGHIYPCGFLGELDLGDDLKTALRKSRDVIPHCMKCHWECFRDPSQLFGMARYIIMHPIRTFFLKRIDPVLLKLWFGDIKYYLQCGLFDGRTQRFTWGNCAAPVKC